MGRAGQRVAEPLAQDPVGAMAALLRVRPGLQDVCRFASQWDTVHEAEPPGWAQFHIVTKGRCLLERYGGGPLRLEIGSLLLLPHGDAHVVRSARRGGSSGMPVRIEYNNAGRIKTNTRDESDTELICGRLHFDAVPYSLVIAALPKTIVLSLGPEKLVARMLMLAQTINEELD